MVMNKFLRERTGFFAPKKTFLTQLIEGRVADEAVAKRTGHNVKRVSELRTHLSGIIQKAPEIFSELTSETRAELITKQLRERPDLFRLKYGLSPVEVSTLEFILRNNEAR